MMIAKLGIAAFAGNYGVTFDATNHCFNLLNSNVVGGKVTIQLDSSNGIVSTATIKSGTTGEVACFVEYSYDSSFYNGTIPVAYDIFLGKGANAIKLFAIHVLQLSVTNGVLPVNLLDPAQAFRSNKPTVLTITNGSLFTQRGEKVLSKTEKFAKKPGVTRRIVFVRICLLLVVLLPLVFLGVQLNKHNNEIKLNK